ncbi:hypothetical protein [Cellulomonas sp.]|uniref:hypothetical protein n=1 Tax=Cellulomonas sp. TaxID=40001 RepID=UPI001B0BC8FB|nr:hypothetical protein [Cellulomonas sp.]MBO9553606.1 hypothetical protein [Cellulomonas sp.]
MGTWITWSGVAVPSTWALWGAGEHEAKARTAPAQLADTREGQQLVRRAILGAESKIEGVGTLVALLAWVPDRTTGAVQALGGCWRIGWPEGTRPTRDEYLAEARKLDPAPGVTIEASTFTTLEVDAGPVAVEGLVTSSAPRRRFGGLLRTADPMVAQIRCTIFPEGCDEVFRIEAVVDDLDLAGAASAQVGSIAKGVVLRLSER